MDVKKIIIWLAASLLILALVFCTFKVLNTGDTDDTTQVRIKSENQVDKKNINSGKMDNNRSTEVKSGLVQIDEPYHHANSNMYNDIPPAMLPLSAITELAELSDDVKTDVEKIVESNTIYVLQKENDKLFVVAENLANIRHGVEFVEISLKNGHQTKSALGYNGKIQDSDNDKWEYDSETSQPTKHIKYDKNGDVEFTEEWNYDDSNPIKYEMKDGSGNVISLRKETLEDGTNLRVEHLLYDKNGTTKVNISATYEQSNLKRFTYYNADKPQESVSVFSEYSDGQKTEETVFTSDLKVKNVYKADYKDGNKKQITVYDDKNNEVGKYTSD